MKQIIHIPRRVALEEGDSGDEVDDERFEELDSNKTVMDPVEDEPMVIQFTIKHEQNIDCGGDYIKLFDCKLDQATCTATRPTTSGARMTCSPTFTPSSSTPMAHTRS